MTLIDHSPARSETGKEELWLGIQDLDSRRTIATESNAINGITAPQNPHRLVWLGAGVVMMRFLCPVTGIALLSNTVGDDGLCLLRRIRVQRISG
jgi:hypothetical protein